MNISKITAPIGKTVNKLAQKTGEAIQGQSKLAKGASKLFNKYEANGADNSFLGLATIMGAFVVVPRVKSALKRNPDNKEATKDEIKEILFRDLQTIAIILFGLKSMNSLIANASTKLTGIPMVNKSYKKVFAKGSEGVGQRLKNFGSNILATINPVGGSKSLNGKQINSLYSNFPDKDSVVKMLDDVENRGGRKNAVFAKVKESVISSLDSKIKANKATSTVINGASSNQPIIDNLEEKRKFFKDLTLEKFQEKGFGIQDEPTAIVAGNRAFLITGNKAADYEKEMLDALSDKKSNKLAFSANVVNSALKTLALGIEVSYLGFGLPALNQRRLEKKYLSEKPIGEQRGDTFTPINDRHIKAQEIQLYSNFIK